MSYKSTIFSLLALSSVAQAVNHDINVGPGLIYNPSNTIAAAGDTLTFSFLPKNHDVAQGDFSTPCAPLAGGFYSGFITPKDGEEEAPVKFIVTVNNTDPIWFFCSAPKHCQFGMVGGVNLPSTATESFELYLNASSKATESKTPAAVSGGIFTTDDVKDGEKPPTSSASSAASASSASSAATSSRVASAVSSAISSAATAASSAAATPNASASTTPSPAASKPNAASSMSFHVLAAAFAGLVFWAGLV